MPVTFDPSHVKLVEPVGSPLLAPPTGYEMFLYQRYSDPIVVAFQRVTFAAGELTEAVRNG